MKICIIKEIVTEEDKLNNSKMFYFKDDTYIEEVMPIIKKVVF